MTVTGTIVDHDDGSTIRFERHLPYPAEAVWAALTEQEQLNQWFSAGSIEPREGGAVELVGPKHIPVAGTVLAWDPPRVLELEWLQRNTGRTTVRYELAPDDAGGTLLTLTHDGLQHDHARGYIPGQHAYLDRLAAHLAGAEIPDWEERYRVVQPAYPPMLAR